MSTQKNKRYQFPHSLLAHLKATLGDRFTVLPERVQKGYTTLLWNNQYITKANRHEKEAASWKTSAETLLSDLLNCQSNPIPPVDSIIPPLKVRLCIFLPS